MSRSIRGGITFENRRTLTLALSPRERGPDDPCPQERDRVGWMKSARSSSATSPSPRLNGTPTGERGRKWRGRPDESERPHVSVARWPVSRVLYPNSLSLIGTTAIHLVHGSRRGSSGQPGGLSGLHTPPYLALHRAGFAVPHAVARWAVRSCRTGSPLPRFACAFRGGMFSVALSVGLPRPAFRRRPARWCPDFPPRFRAAAVRPPCTD